MKIGVVVFPSNPIQDKVNNYRKRYDPHYALIQPHITLKEATDIKEEELTAISSFLEGIADQCSPFEVELNRVSHFHPTHNVIYLGLSDPDPVINIHNLMKAGPLGQDKSSYSYIPHMTIGQKMTSEELHDVYASLKRTKFNLTFIVDRFHLLNQTENGTWTVYQTFSFKKQP